MTEKLIYDFMDRYTGKEFVINKSNIFYNPFNFNPEYNYSIVSDNGVVILRFSQKGSMVDGIGEQCLSTVVCNFFSLSYADSKNIVKKWFFEKARVSSISHFADKYRHLFPL